MNILNRRNRIKPMCSALIAGLVFVALLLPIVTPGLNPGLVGAQPFHGHIAFDGEVEPHSHDLDSVTESEIVFTSDDSGSSNSAPVIITPAIERFSPTGELVAQSVRSVNSIDQWTPRLIPAPPKLSV